VPVLDGTAKLEVPASTQPGPSSASAGTEQGPLVGGFLESLEKLIGG
jgi:hypothetical protein